MNKKNEKCTVYAYGFDAMGFRISTNIEEHDLYTIRHINYNSDESLEEANGLVIPSGIFEKVHKATGEIGSHFDTISHDSMLLAARQKQLYNSLKGKAWVVFLIGVVNNGSSGKWKHTDLSKIYINSFADAVYAHGPMPIVESKYDEFGSYIKKFGIAQSSFQFGRRNGDARILAQIVNGMPVGFESQGRLFFLPFFTTARDKTEIVAEAVRSVVSSVLEYKSKNDIYFPPWMGALRFKTEAKLEADKKQTEQRLVGLSDEIEKWRRYKAILCTSGQNLNAATVHVLRDFFGLNLKSQEKYIEDALIHSSTGDIRYVVEIKGVKGGVKREQINQVDSHRERLGISHEIPGLLIINDFMDIDNYKERKSKTFDSGQLDHARKLNVKILRTSTLFDWMLQLEERPGLDRQVAFFELCAKANPLVTLPGIHTTPSP